MPGARAHFSLVLLAALSLVGCRPAVDLARALQVEVVSTGWFDAGVQDGKNKLVPSIAVRLTNVSSQTLVVLQVNGLFRRVADKDEWGSAFQTVAGSEGLAPGAKTSTVTLQSQLGYTGSESRADMLANPEFVDARVDLFAKYGSAQWTRLGEYPIARQLIQR
jgi:hypothetical protein